MTSTKQCSLAFQPRFPESYSVKYWDRSGKYAKQVSQIVYTRKKGQHQEAADFICESFNVSKEDIVSVIYQ